MNVLFAFNKMKHCVFYATPLRGLNGTLLIYSTNISPLWGFDFVLHSGR
jgi:hypothetical protein